jgi:DNA repair ATPase RecN
MIHELRVRDLATIADVTLSLGTGLNVLTGETGAGKSMLVDALSLLLGERAASGAVRPGAAKSIVEGAFEGLDAPMRRRLEDLGLDAEDGRIVVRREVSAEGRSRAWVNGSPTTAAVLSQLGAVLVDLHGQHETQSLLHPRPSATSSMPSPTRRASAGRWPRRGTRWRRCARRRRGSPRGGTRCAAAPTTCATSSGRSTSPR